MPTRTAAHRSRRSPAHLEPNERRRPGAARRRARQSAPRQPWQSGRLVFLRHRRHQTEARRPGGFDARPLAACSREVQRRPRHSQGCRAPGPRGSTGAGKAGPWAGSRRSPARGSLVSAQPLLDGRPRRLGSRKPETACRLARRAGNAEEDSVAADALCQRRAGRRMSPQSTGRHSRCPRAHSRALRPAR